MSEEDKQKVRGYQKNYHKLNKYFHFYFIFSIKDGLKQLMFGDIETEKSKFYKSKYPTDINEVEIKKILYLKKFRILVGALNFLIIKMGKGLDHYV